MSLPTSYRGIPVTPRTGEELALFHGYDDLSQLIEMLPDQARVLDVGAGRSTLGRKVALRRPDVTWVNMDPAYSDNGIRDTVTRGAVPDNLQFVADGGENIGNHFAPGAFNRVFSFFTLPHLDKLTAENVAEAIVTATADEGEISIGPIFDKWDMVLLLGSDALIDSTIKAVKTPDLAPNDFAVRSVARILHPSMFV